MFYLAAANSGLSAFWEKFASLLPSIDIWAFGAASSVMGLLIVIADLVFFKLHGKSLLKLAYAGIGRTLLVMMLWGVGAGLIGILGAIFGLFQVTQQASVLVGIAWPVTLPRLLQAATIAAEDEQKG